MYLFALGVGVASPYDGLASDKWEAKTEELIAAHPVDTGQLVDVIQTAWSAIFDTKLGGKFSIGKEISPKPQIMGFLLHELIPLELELRSPKTWRTDKEKGDKDLVYIPDPSKSVELKTSSHPSQIFGNRSYAQPQPENARGKSKNGYYLTVNFQNFALAGKNRPEITLVRFGWLDHTDWLAQTSATGQQARVSPASDRTKLKVLYRSK